MFITFALVTLLFLGVGAFFLRHSFTLFLCARPQRSYFISYPSDASLALSQLLLFLTGGFWFRVFYNNHFGHATASALLLYCCRNL